MPTKPGIVADAAQAREGHAAVQAGVVVEDLGLRQDGCQGAVLVHRCARGAWHEDELSHHLHHGQDHALVLEHVRVRAQLGLTQQAVAVRGVRHREGLDHYAGKRCRASFVTD